ncbi:hypothetical protein M514_02236 [Trichuris suis]|uniref:Uncharacterized protein n=1 Tax=Trichuris suis TaxID=68888 RepID=A0A085NKT7_9BILA|nr:hypothetical protein M513_02236 [Trichuris suis]KFD70083.1 hypothetical protein M514_02236 [Trichuris suis]
MWSRVVVLEEELTLLVGTSIDFSSKSYWLISVNFGPYCFPFWKCLEMLNATYTPPNAKQKLFLVHPSALTSVGTAEPERGRWRVCLGSITENPGFISSDEVVQPCNRSTLREEFRSAVDSSVLVLSCQIVWYLSAQHVNVTKPF